MQFEHSTELARCGETQEPSTSARLDVHDVQAMGPGPEQVEQVLSHDRQRPDTSSKYLPREQLVHAYAPPPADNIVFRKPRVGRHGNGGGNQVYRCRLSRSGDT